MADSVWKRIVQRFLMGVEYRLDGGLALAPTVPDGWWRAGFGQTLTWRGRTLNYRFQGDGISGSYAGDESLVLHVRPHRDVAGETRQVYIDGVDVAVKLSEGWLELTLPPAKDGKAVIFTATLKL